MEKIEMEVEVVETPAEAIEIMSAEYTLDMDEEGLFPLDEDVSVKLTINPKNNCSVDDFEQLLRDEADMLAGGDEDASDDLFKRFKESFIDNDASEATFVATRTEDGKIISNYQDNQS